MASAAHHRCRRRIDSGNLTSRPIDRRVARKQPALVRSKPILMNERRRPNAPFQDAHSFGPRDPVPRWIAALVYLLLNQQARPYISRSLAAAG